MATPQLSPGVLIREVDLTVGRSDNTLENIGGFAGPFSQGPVSEIVDITTEADLLKVYGKPLSTDRQYEYWMSCSSFLSYGGRLKTVRIDGGDLKNAIVGTSTTTAAIKIRNYDEYNESYSADTVSWLYAAKNPGTWSNNLKICAIDAFADQRISIGTSDPVGLGITVGLELRKSLSQAVAGVGTTSAFTGHLRGFIVGINSVSSGNATIDVKIVSRVSSAGTEVSIEYAPGTTDAAFADGDTISFRSATGEVSTGISTTVLGSGSVLDWYDQQTLDLTNTSLYWKSIAPRPGTTAYARQRNSKNDEIHVAVVDDLGTFTGSQGVLIEKFTGLSKASDAISEVNSPAKNNYKQFIALNSSVIYVGGNSSNTSSIAISPKWSGTGISTNPSTLSSGIWNQNAQGVTFNVIGNKSYTLGGNAAWKGIDYGESSGTMAASLGSLTEAYQKFSNEDEVTVDFLIGGPGLVGELESQAHATNLISIASGRKDCIATISPNRASVLGGSGPLPNATQTTNLVKFFSGISQSSSYGVFDSTWKYTYDRFNNQFVYIPCSADVAGMMVRTSIEAYPWYSPAGQQRGVLNNAIKLAYNPSKAQRDTIYPQRINPIVNLPGTGTVLFGDKTALTYQSAFDRINVRRLFITLRKSLTRAANAQLFEFNDSITRANFVNIVEPYLRDIQAKRGVYDFLVVCDESNNTPDVIDNNEFRADIYLKPAKSINYVTLTFVATRTGVSFDEVVGTV